VAIENKSCKSFVQPNEFVNTALQKFSLRWRKIQNHG
jgi:hypothetical protein